MCGLSGTVNWGDDIELDRMTRIQMHRGPDDWGIYRPHPQAGQQVRLGSCRLAILDLSPAGHMPMSTPNGEFTIAYNGEVYNHPQLRQELGIKGYQFHSFSDTETVLYLFQEYGVDCVKRLNGMFAMAIWDAAQQRLFLARDHFGIKPLYYYYYGSRLAFASEIKSLLELSDIPRRINLRALHQYLSFLWVPDPLTMFEDIYKLPAGHYALFQDGELDIVQYWDVSYPQEDYDFQVDEISLTAELRERFSNVVKSQMLSDVTIGAFLSAGLDSSSIVAMMAKHSQHPVHTFTIAFPEKHRRGELTLDDTAVARRTAGYLGCDHSEIIVEPQVADLLPNLIWHMDEPIADPAIIAAYLINQEARKTVTVLLSGVGGDELFAGYRKYQAHYLAAQYQRLPGLLRQRVIEPAVATMPSFQGTPLNGYMRLAKKMARSGSMPPRDRFIADSVYLTESQKSQLYSDNLRRQLDGFEPRQQHLSYFQSASGADFLNQMMYVDIKAFMVSLNLTYNDKMSMASSVEVRVPFLDWELAEWIAWNIPPSLKLHGGQAKYILREAMRPLLPPEVLEQKKAGFGAPINYWLANDLRDLTDDVLSERNLKQRGMFEANTVRSLIKQQRSGRQDWSFQIWQLLTFELWLQTFID